MRKADEASGDSDRTGSWAYATLSSDFVELHLRGFCFIEIGLVL